MEALVAKKLPLTEDQKDTREINIAIAEIILEAIKTLEKVNSSIVQSDETNKELDRSNKKLVKTNIKLQQYTVGLAALAIIVSAILGIVALLK